MYKDIITAKLHDAEILKYSVKAERKQEWVTSLFYDYPLHSNVYCEITKPFKAIIQIITNYTNYNKIVDWLIKFSVTCIFLNSYFF